jgi:beta-phosphoglucomutase
VSETTPVSFRYDAAMFRAVVFDFNGILVDDEPVHYEMFRRVLADEGIELSREDYYRDYLGLDDRGCLNAVFERAGQPLPLPRLMRLIARKASYYQERIRDGGYPFFPGAVALVREAAAAGWMLGVVSGALREEVEGALRQEGLLEFFKILVTAEDVEASKPNPAGYLRAIEAFNSEPPLPERLVHGHEVLVLEDSPAGLAAARDAGLTAVGVGQSYPVGELEGADAVVSSLAGLTLDQLVRLFA